MCTHTSLGRFEGFLFVLNSAWFYTRLPPQEKLLHKSHSSLNSVWWAVLTLKLGSEQSLAYIFQEIGDSYCGECLWVFLYFGFVWLLFSISPDCSHYLKAAAVVILLNFSNTTITDMGKPCFQRACSAVTVTLVLTMVFVLFHSRFIQLNNEAFAEF